MAKAHIKTPEGIVVEVEGSPAEISAMVEDLRNKLKAERPASRHSKPSGRVLLVDLIASLIDSGYFKKPRSLGDMKATLAEMGHHYPVTTLSPVMLRQVRRKNLRRVRGEKLWLYTEEKGTHESANRNHR